MKYRNFDTGGYGSPDWTNDASVVQFLPETEVRHFYRILREAGISPLDAYIHVFEVELSVGEEAVVSEPVQRFNFQTNTLAAVDWTDDDVVIQFIAPFGARRARYRYLRSTGSSPRSAFLTVIREKFKRAYMLEGWASYIERPLLTSVSGFDGFLDGSETLDDLLASAARQFVNPIQLDELVFGELPLPEAEPSSLLLNRSKVNEQPALRLPGQPLDSQKELEF